MRRLALVGSLCTTLLAALPAAGGTILYATAASLNRVDGFCVGAGGGFVPGANIVPADTKGTEPRRLLVAPGPGGVDGVLYVGERDRVEAFTIGPRGGLKFLGSTTLIKDELPAIKNELPMDVMDMAFNPDGRTLYVAQNGPDRIAAYPLDPKTGLVLAPKTGFTSCIQGRPNAAYRALLVRNSLLYVSEQLTPGRIANFPIDAGGGLGHDPTECSGQRPKVCNAGSRARQVCTTDDTDATTGCPGATCPGCCVALTLPISERRRIERPRSFLILDDRVYVEEVETKRIKAFSLQPDGLFPPPTMVGKRLRWEKPVSRTASVLGYADLLLFRSTLLASQFEKGRIDAYRLKPDGRLPRQPTRHTKEDVRTSPVRMTISRCSGGSNDGLACASAMECPGGTCPSAANVLYVAAGELDRVQAFRLRQSDGLPSPAPFSQTDEQTGSFPNDVALAVLSDECR